MIRVAMGDLTYTMSWISACALRRDLDIAIEYEEQSFAARIGASIARDEARRVAKEWKAFAKFWGGDEPRDVR